MSERTDEHRPASDPPGAVSNQNGEEAQSGHRGDATHPEPRTSERPEPRTSERRPEGGESEGREGDTASESGPSPPGAAGEGTQSTGNPLNAG